MKKSYPSLPPYGTSSWQRLVAGEWEVGPVQAYAPVCGAHFLKNGWKIFTPSQSTFGTPSTKNDLALIRKIFLQTLVEIICRYNFFLNLSFISSDTPSHSTFWTPSTKKWNGRSEPPANKITKNKDFKYGVLGIKIV